LSRIARFDITIRSLSLQILLVCIEEKSLFIPFFQIKNLIIQQSKLRRLVIALFNLSVIIFGLLYLEVNTATLSEFIKLKVAYEPRLSLIVTPIQELNNC